eukprot:291187_1
MIQTYFNNVTNIDMDLINMSVFDLFSEKYNFLIPNMDYINAIFPNIQQIIIRNFALSYFSVQNVCAKLTSNIKSIQLIGEEKDNLNYLVDKFQQNHVWRIEIKNQKTHLFQKCLCITQTNSMSPQRIHFNSKHSTLAKYFEPNKKILSLVDRIYHIIGSEETFVDNKYFISAIEDNIQSIINLFLEKEPKNRSRFLSILNTFPNVTKSESQQICDFLMERKNKQQFMSILNTCPNVTKFESEHMWDLLTVKNDKENADHMGKDKQIELLKKKTEIQKQKLAQLEDDIDSIIDLYLKSNLQILNSENKNNTNLSDMESKSICDMLYQNQHTVSAAIKVEQIDLLTKKTTNKTHCHDKKMSVIQENVSSDVLKNDKLIYSGLNLTSDRSTLSLSDMNDIDIAPSDALKSLTGAHVIVVANGMVTEEALNAPGVNAGILSLETVDKMLNLMNERICSPKQHLQSIPEKSALKQQEEFISCELEIPISPMASSVYNEEYNSNADHDQFYEYDVKFTSSTLGFSVTGDENAMNCIVTNCSYSDFAQQNVNCGSLIVAINGKNVYGLPFNDIYDIIEQHASTPPLIITFRSQTIHDESGYIVTPSFDLEASNNLQELVGGTHKICNKSLSSQMECKTQNERSSNWLNNDADITYAPNQSRDNILLKIVDEASNEYSSYPTTVPHGQQSTNSNSSHQNNTDNSNNQNNNTSQSTNNNQQQGSGSSSHGGSGGGNGGGKKNPDDRHKGNGSKKKKKKSKKEEKKKDDNLDEKDDEFEGTNNDQSKLNSNAPVFVPAARVKFRNKAPNLFVIEEENDENDEKKEIEEKQLVTDDIVFNGEHCVSIYESKHAGKNKANNGKQCSYSPTNSFSFPLNESFIQSVMQCKCLVSCFGPNINKKQVQSYLYKSIAIQANGDINKIHTFKSNGKRFKIINYDFFQNELKQYMYVVVQLNGRNKNKFEFMVVKNANDGYLFTEKMIRDCFKKPRIMIPKSPRNTKTFISQLQSEHDVKNILWTMLQNKNTRRKEFGKLPWQMKQHIYGRTGNQNKQKITLSLKKMAFVDSIINFADKIISKNCFQLTPIIMFENHGYSIHFVWIVSIATGTDMGCTDIAIS